jgi:hypothetical protein
MKTLDNIRALLNAALIMPTYDCKETITVLKRIPEFCYAYSLLNSKKRSYNLEEHTVMVCQMFENLFSLNYCYKEFSISAFRLLLCLHDIGKPYSLLDNQKEKQWEYTVKMIENYKQLFPFSDHEYKIAIALISDDPLGLYIRGKIELNEAICRIQVMFTDTEVSIDTFMTLLIIYYQVDSGAYTRQGYIGPAEDFFEKPKLEAVFEKNKTGQLIYLPEKHRLAFSNYIEEKVRNLLEGLGINNG